MLQLKNAAIKKPNSKGECTSMKVNLKTPIEREDTEKLRVKDTVYITGTIYTARDSAHKRILERGTPVNLEGAVIFHAGPIIREAEGGYQMVAVGPTTSTRMNPYQPEVLDQGVKVVVGKGGMDENTAEALKRNGAVFLAAVGGCAALYVRSVEKIKEVHWLDLGVPEAIWELEVRDFGPLIVTMDSAGGNLYEEVRQRNAP
jgi:fumarate hydratase subunit beta